MNTTIGWETVGIAGKPIKKTGSNKQVAKLEAEAKRKFAEKAPKLEEVLPYSEIASIYSASYEPVRPVKSGQTNGTGQKPDKTKKPEKKSDKKSEAPKQDQKPRSVEEAAKLISAVHLKHLLATTKSNYPGDPLLWIRDAAAYLNLTLNLTSNELGTADFQAFGPKPVAVLNKETKKTLTSLLDESGDAARSSAFETLLANMSHDMAKGQNVHGYMIMLQLLSDSNPSLCLLRASSSRFLELRNSYQNRPNIGTALLWAVGLGGKHDLQVGLKDGLIVNLVENYANTY